MSLYTVSVTAPSAPAAEDRWFDTVNYIEKIYDGANWIGTTSITKGVYGDGSDGALTTSGDDEDLTGGANRDMYFTDLTISHVGATSKGYRIFVKGVLTVDSGKSISVDGGDAGVAPAAGIAGGATGTLMPGVIGGTGGVGAAVGNAGTATSVSGGGSGGAGGQSGGGADAGGVAGVATAPTGAEGGIPKNMPHACSLTVVPDAAVPQRMEGGASGGGGAGDAAQNGGGGGGGAGVIFIAARTIVLVGDITANGGAGQDADGGNGGGGGGGGGGLVVLVYDAKSGEGNVTASLGAKGLKAGTGDDGVDGSAGNVVEIQNQ